MVINKSTQSSCEYVISVMRFFSNPLLTVIHDNAIRVITGAATIGYDVAILYRLYFQHIRHKLDQHACNEHEADGLAEIEKLTWRLSGMVREYADICEGYGSIHKEQRIGDDMCDVVEFIISNCDPDLLRRCSSERY